MCHLYGWVFRPRFSKQDSSFDRLFKHGWTVVFCQNWPQKSILRQRLVIGREKIPGY